MIFVGNVLISLDDEDEALLRRLARERRQGKKGALSGVVSEAVRGLAERDRRVKSARRLVEKMRCGFDLGLGGKRVYKSRSEIYD